MHACLPACLLFMNCKFAVKRLLAMHSHLLRVQLELFCISKLINCLLDADEEFVFMDVHFAIGELRVQAVSSESDRNVHLMLKPCCMCTVSRTG